jgi:hypothetical protein
VAARNWCAQRQHTHGVGRWSQADPKQAIPLNSGRIWEKWLEKAVAVICGHLQILDSRPDAVLLTGLRCDHRDGMVS